MRTDRYSDENESIIVKYMGDITTVEIYDRHGNYARGSAKYHPDDRYTEDFGKALALARASQRYFKKIEKQLVKSTK